MQHTPQAQWKRKKSPRPAAWPSLNTRLEKPSELSTAPMSQPHSGGAMCTQACVLKLWLSYKESRLL